MRSSNLTTRRPIVSDDASLSGELVDVRLGLVVTVVVLVVISRMTGGSEHLAPETAAALGEEGVGEPGRAFTDLVADFTVPKDRAADGARA